MLYLVTCGLAFAEAVCGPEIASIREGNASSSFYFSESAEEAVDWQASSWPWGRSSDHPIFDDSAFIIKDQFKYPLRSALAAFS
jgi:hypothetical protein